ncbi:hypothetical protein [Leekyejoonella antrihumi]|uniref:Uncharacterized protein n=1 Tax=Leekyejoonella antrihumi TaxID=1660198 RepID=A0A563E9K2_9MICO|nr:hypothetical protein [Leekyejoonella antrihumi]TWP38913.1 hypothetical protein FGL98_00465 [Leekyejoonella antrihumi]
MEALAIFVGICVGPAAFFLLLGWSWRACNGMRPLRRRSTSAPTHPPVERMAVDLHWLADEMCRLRVSRAPAKVHRLTAVGLAYDDTLRMCCDALDVPVPDGRELDGVERLQLEAELAQAGLDW